MRIFDVLYSMNTGNARAGARPFDTLLGQSLAGGEKQKTVDFTPIISVSDALAKPVVDFQAKIVPVQSGSGDPSPTNIRPITGWTGANIHVNSDTIPVSWQTEAGTVYGGVVDVTTGKLWVTHIIETLDGTTTGKKLTGSWGNNSYAYHLNMPYPRTYIKPYESVFSNCLTYSNASYDNMPAFSFRGGSGVITTATMKLTSDYPNITSANQFLRDMYNNNTPIQFIVELETPLEYDLTPTEITLLQGSNTLWSDTGDSAMTYLAKKA